MTNLLVDSNGYVNQEKPLSENGYVLVMGSSMVEGAQVAQDKRYTDLLNQKFAKKGELVVYNMGRSGCSYTDIMKGFSAAIKEFPDAKAVIIDVMDANYSPEDVRAGLEQREFNESDLAKNIDWNQLGIKQEIRTTSPFLYNLWLKLSQIRLIKHDNKVFYNKSIKNAGKSDSVNNDCFNEFVSTMEMAKQSFNGSIIIVYHPFLLLNESGSINITKAEFVDDMKAACAASGVIWVDCSKPFEEEYVQSYRLPYGFHNTSFGGWAHMNETGHSIMADVLYPYLVEILE